MADRTNRSEQGSSSILLGPGNLTALQKALQDEVEDYPWRGFRNYPPIKPSREIPYSDVGFETSGARDNMKLRRVKDFPVYPAEPTAGNLLERQ
ncbi:hypothetical protein J6590_093073 [Homalodisca vitripennis]|nr:hypothetical protein J6590_093073 [Homalodisca vitripennis]